jgi:hypothetical protein
MEDSTMPNHVRAPSRAAPPPRRLALARGALLALGLSLPATWLFVACTDTPPPAAPGNVVFDDSMQDAELQNNEDASIQYGPQGLGEAGTDGAYGLDSTYGSSGYEDVQSPQSACSSCKCDMRVGYCLENGPGLTASTAAPVSGFCGLASTLSIGCNALPAACASSPTCACVLDAVQPPLGCYPECTTSSGYIDVFCQNP